MIAICDYCKGCWKKNHASSNYWRCRFNPKTKKADYFINPNNFENYEKCIDKNRMGACHKFVNKDTAK
jgi:hypothetical protein